MPINAEELYKNLKDIEGLFPIPTPSVTLNIGTFSGTSGAFSGKKTSIRYESTADVFPTKFGKKPATPPAHYAGDKKIITTIQGSRIQIKTIYAPKVNAVDVLFTFQLKDSQTSGFVVIINGNSYNYPPGTTSATINVSRVSAVNWKITSGTKSYSDYVELRREPIIGVGAFTLKALPIAIIYEPPPDRKHLNRAVYEHSHSIGSKTRFTMIQESENTKQSREGKWETNDIMLTIVDGALDLLKLLPFADKLTTVGIVLTLYKKFIEGPGDVVNYNTTGIGTTSEHELTFEQLAGRIHNTGPNNGGPGIGDIIYYLKNPMVMWIADNTGVHLSILDEVPLMKSVGVGFLKANRTNPQELRKYGVDPEVVDDLLGLDPFVANPTGEPPSDRYELIDAQEPTATGNGQTIHLKKTWSKSDRKVTHRFDIEIVDQRAGWLNFIGLGINEPGVSKIRGSSSNLTEVTNTKNTLANVEYHCDEDEVYAFEVYVDHVFGSFAFRSIPVDPVARMSGKVVNKSGKPVTKKRVLLVIGGKRYSTNTNQHGDFEYHAKAIGSGQTKIYIDNKLVKTLTLQANKPVQNLKLQPEKKFPDTLSKETIKNQKTPFTR